MLVICERRGNPLAAHQLESHRVGKGERLIRESGEPPVDRSLKQLGRCVVLLDYRIGQQCRDGPTRRVRLDPAQKVSMQFSQHQRAAYPSSTAGTKPLFGGDRAPVVLVPGAREGEERAGIDCGARHSLVRSLAGGSPA